VRSRAAERGRQAQERVLPQVSTPGGQECLSIDPAPPRWPELLAPRESRPLVIMTGHQAEFWHPGILAKYFAAGAAARALNASGRNAVVHWTVPDQDSHDPSRIAYPMKTAGGPAKAAWSVPFRAGATLSAGAFSPDTPLAALPPLEAPRDLAGAVKSLRPALPCVEEGLLRIGEAIRTHSSEPSVARQITRSLCDLATAAVPDLKPAKLVYASELHRHDIFSELLERMRADPSACTLAYNAAVARRPHAHVRALVNEPGRAELPLWRMPDKPGRARRPVFASDLPDVDPSHLAPRALLMTALERLAMCDLFIHGTGGGQYDRITEEWLSRWLPGRKLAPTAVVTATRLLPFEITPPPPREIARARWRAHHARHDPRAFGDAGAEARKQTILKELRTARSRGESPSRAFTALHTLLDDVRSRHGSELAALDAQAADGLRQRDLAEVVHDRTWPFPLYPQETLRALRSDVDAAFGLWS
jgi:hypothetical protein